MSRCSVSPLPAWVQRSLPRAPWTEDRELSWDNADLAGLTRAQIWAVKRQAENSLLYLVSRGRDGLAWSPYRDAPRRATAWLSQRIDACDAALKGRWR